MGRCYFSTSRQPLMWSAPPWSSNEMSQAMSTRYNDPFTSSVKYSASPRYANPRCRNSSTRYLSRQESCAITSRRTMSRWSPLSHSVTYSTIETPTAGSSSGRWNKEPCPSSSSLAPPSSHKPWPTSSPNGRRSRTLHPTNDPSTGSCTLMALSTSPA